MLVTGVVFDDCGLRSSLSDFVITDIAMARLKAWRQNSNSPAASWRRMSSSVFIEEGAATITNAVTPHNPSKKVYRSGGREGEGVERRADGVWPIAYGTDS
jgi:hypothetical protein